MSADRAPANHGAADLCWLLSAAAAATAALAGEAVRPGKCTANRGSSRRKWDLIGRLLIFSQQLAERGDCGVFFPRVQAERWREKETAIKRDKLCKKVICKCLLNGKKGSGCFALESEGHFLSVQILLFFLRISCHLSQTWKLHPCLYMWNRSL